MFANLPLTALRTFESAARLQSFKAAAEELAVTPTAVSHQIRTLENWLGVALFERLARGVRLTECGERLFGSLHGALLDIVQSVAQLRPQPSTGSLTLSTTPAFAALWLIPQLGQFYQAHPGIKVRVETSTELLDLQQDASIDLVIRYGYGSHPSLHSQCLLDERFGVYGAPGLLAALDPARLTLITVRWRNSQLYDRSWKAWCAIYCRKQRLNSRQPASPGWNTQNCASTTRSITRCRPPLPGKAWSWRAMCWFRRAWRWGCCSHCAPI